MIYCIHFPGTKLSYHPQLCLGTEQNILSPPAVLVSRRASCRCIMRTPQRAKKLSPILIITFEPIKKRGRKLKRQTDLWEGQHISSEGGVLSCITRVQAACNSMRLTGNLSAIVKLLYLMLSFRNVIKLSNKNLWYISEHAFYTHNGHSKHPSDIIQGYSKWLSEF
jgi:hypothetical protein